MTRAELEQLLSAYMDGELSPQEMKKAEALVKTNAQAKSILDDYLFVRKAIQHEAKTLQYKVPTDFAAGVLTTIDAAVQPSKPFKSDRYTRNETISRWSNPRIFTYPLVILVCALLIGVFYRSDTSDTTPPIARSGSISGQLTISSPDETIIPPPLADSGGTLSLLEKPVQPERTDLKLVCRTENTASVSTLFTRVFAKYNVVSNRSTSGGNVVYEISVTPETLRAILEEFQANSIEITGDTENLGVEKPVKVFFLVE